MAPSPVARARRVLEIGEIAAVIAVGGGVLASVLAPDLRGAAAIRHAGLAALLASPFAALAALALTGAAARRARRFAVGALAVAALGVWIAL